MGRRGPQGQLGAPGALKGDPRGSQNDPLELRNLYFSIQNVKNTNESIWITAESYGGLIWGSKALMGNIFFKISSKNLRINYSYKLSKQIILMMKVAFIMRVAILFFRFAKELSEKSLSTDDDLNMQIEISGKKIPSFFCKTKKTVQQPS